MTYNFIYSSSSLFSSFTILQCDEILNVSDQRGRGAPMGGRLSYKVGAWMMMLKVPTRHTAVKIHRNKRSRTIATNCQSCLTYSTIQISLRQNCWNSLPLSVKNSTSQYTFKTKLLTVDQGPYIINSP